VIAVAQRDPSRTTMLRQAFMRDMRKRFRAIQKAVTELVAEEDVFGLAPPNIFSGLQVNIEPQAWRFQTNPQKLTSFRTWFQKQVNEGVLEVDGITGKPWTAKYVNSAYKKGVLRSYTDAHKEEFGKPAGFYEGSKEEFLRSSFASPERVSKMELLSTRSYEDLRGVSATMSQRMARTLTLGMAEGRNPRELARQLNRTVASLTRTRALTIARTEIIYAHAEGQLDGLEDLGFKKVSVQVEWMTAGDERVCDRCAHLEGVVMKIAQARGLIPLHPNCRCAFAPAMSDYRRPGQKWGPSSVRKRLEKAGAYDQRGGAFRRAGVIARTPRQRIAKAVRGRQATMGPVAGKESNENLMIRLVQEGKTEAEIEEVFFARYAGKGKTEAWMRERIATYRRTAARKLKATPSVSKPAAPAPPSPTAGPSLERVDLRGRRSVFKALEEYDPHFQKLVDRANATIGSRGTQGVQEILDATKVELRELKSAFRRLKESGPQHWEYWKTPEYRELNVRITAVKRRAKDAIDGGAAGRDVWLKACQVAPDEAAGIAGVNVSPELSWTTKKKVDKLVDDVRKLVRKDALRGRQKNMSPIEFVLDRSTTRSHYYRRAPETYVDPGRPLASAKMGANAPPGTFVHEFGHHIEDQNKHFKNRCNALVKGRAKKRGVKLQHLGDRYGLDEMGLPTEDWMDAYCTKVYRSGDTEVMSMGLELFYKDPQKFLEGDREHFKLIVGLLRGEI